jgi:flagellar biosynthesis/type III secretory pathway protein FliH
MKSDLKKVEEIIDEHKSHLESINDGIMEGISAGIREGVTKGLKNGLKGGLKECFVEGFIDIGQDDIGDILKDIPEELVKSSVKEGARYIFEESTKDYLQNVCQKLVDRIQKGEVKLSKDQTELVLDLIKRSEKEALNKMVARLPNNPFFRNVAVGMQTALEESLEKNFIVFQEKMCQ